MGRFQYEPSSTPTKTKVTEVFKDRTKKEQREAVEKIKGWGEKEL